MDKCLYCGKEIIQKEHERERLYCDKTCKDDMKNMIAREKYKCNNILMEIREIKYRIDMNRQEHNDIITEIYKLLNKRW